MRPSSLTPETEFAQFEVIDDYECGINVVSSCHARRLERERDVARELEIRVIDWQSQSDHGLRLRCGELTAQEIRTIRAVLSAILPPNALAMASADNKTPKTNGTP